jgi:hypothetical protein
MLFVIVVDKGILRRSPFHMHPLKRSKDRPRSLALFLVPLLNRLFGLSIHTMLCQKCSPIACESNGLLKVKTLCCYRFGGHFFHISKESLDTLRFLVDHIATQFQVWLFNTCREPEDLVKWYSNVSWISCCYHWEVRGWKSEYLLSLLGESELLSDCFLKGVACELPCVGVLVNQVVQGVIPLPFMMV